MNSSTKNSSMKNSSMKNFQVLTVAVVMALGSAAVFAQAKQDGATNPKQRMQELDVNKDGVIDRAEAAKAPRLAERFDQLDTNKDGKLSADERAKMRGKGGGGGKRSGDGAH